MVPNRLYYHLRTMEETGLIGVVGSEVVGRFAERVYGARFLGFGDELARAVLRTTPAKLVELRSRIERLMQEANCLGDQPDARDYRFANALYELPPA